MAYAGLDDFLKRAAARLDPPAGAMHLEEDGDMDFLTPEEVAIIRPAAVLIGVLPRKEGPTALLTVRPMTMASHPGQVAFPGGKVDPIDVDEVAAALREAEEEVGVPTADVDVIGKAAPYVTGTRFRITPVVGLLPADFIAVPDPTEVADVFETPLEFLMNTTNHQMGHAFYKGRERQYYEMPHNGYRIWGVTAGIIRRLYQTLYEG
ncbi:CoA pyrophosphatase [Hyphomonas johnsonii]|jgi:8-oxo-dGTP pyrophosphatase MutT (NUDIX family)|uniref:NUDIX family hydrolase n=1 Tax=Hyphomonas johnsonii MHS-2 TaxID=1280950 RepID=A0A059FIY3_9PROT|nr:CoA pyrophosphatase [Hyphomonas johnsonii]KCZ90620.1 NUDIX family hydrolase [Hyphomonas johnsonii MHS-2]